MKNKKCIRKLKEKDAHFMLEWLNDSEVTRYFQFDTSHMTIEHVNNFIQKSKKLDRDAHFAIVNEGDEYLGTVSLKNINQHVKSAEYAISLRKSAQGKGYAKRATTNILEYAFETLNLNRVYLNVLSENEPAVGFYENYGFVFEGEFKEHVCIDEKIKSLKWFRMMKNEYQEYISTK